MDSRSFTLQADKKISAIKLQIGIAETSSSGKEPKSEYIKTFWAVWDTAANRSCISENIIKELNLEPVSTVNVHTASGIEVKNEFIIDIFLPNNIRFTPIRASEVKSNTHIGFDCIIGMDIISQGDMSLSYADNKTLFSYRAPALGGVDFVKEHQKNMQQQTKKSQKINVVKASRNKMCHCGSGKKFKNCCG